MSSIISLVLLILWIVALVDILKSSMATDKKILWVVVITLLPVLGVILYFLLGRK